MPGAKASRLTAAVRWQSSVKEFGRNTFLNMETLSPYLWDLTHWARTAGSGAAVLLPQFRPQVGARVASPQGSYSGSEGEILSEDISTVVGRARCGNRLLVTRNAVVPIWTTAGTPLLRMAEPDTRCPRIEVRAAGCALLPERILRCGLL